MTKGKEKKLTLRQRLRRDAENELSRLVNLMTVAGERVCEEGQTNINYVDLMRVLVAGQNKTVKAQLITELANEAEAKLEAIYNAQLDMLPGASNDN